MLRYALPILMALSACAPTSTTEVAQRAPGPSLNLPPMKTFSAKPRFGTSRSNAQITQDFLDLSFQMESGRKLPWMTRFSGPIKVSVNAGAPGYLERDLGQLLARLRNEARIPISRAARGEKAQIIIEAIPRKQLQRAVPTAACFVVPNVAGWAEFKSKRGRGITDWTRLNSRERATVIIPSDVSPQEVRDCLHEEIAQALGPLNDLYRLPDSTFNDDNFHTVLTGFDMLILRAYYSPELRNGMTRAEAASVLPRVFARLNPRGNFNAGRPVSGVVKEWNNAISNALAVRSTPSRRAVHATQAVKIAQASGWRDNRLAFSLFVQGRVTLGRTPEKAIAAFLQSGNIYKALYGNSVHTAHVATQMSAFALSSAQYSTAVKIVDEALPAARASENAALLSTLLLIKAEALEKSGASSQARATRLDALGWGRYGFGSERNVRARVNEVKALVPKRG